QWNWFVPSVSGIEDAGDLREVDCERSESGYECLERRHERFERRDRASFFVGK
ncbi:hypothetical protein H6F65_24215, partial [Microcoleus sp. FACHB-DQ6]|nr:hypothetical protein [Microcoleus sp. FACHB-DQ6]